MNTNELYDIRDRVTIVQNTCNDLLNIIDEHIADGMQEANDKPSTKLPTYINHLFGIFDIIENSGMLRHRCTSPHEESELDVVAAINTYKHRIIYDLIVYRDKEASPYDNVVKTPAYKYCMMQDLSNEAIDELIDELKVTWISDSSIKIAYTIQLRYGKVKDGYCTDYDGSVWIPAEDTYYAELVTGRPYYTYVVQKVCSKELIN